MFQSTANPDAGGTSGSATGTGNTFSALAAQASSSTSGQSGVKGASQEGIDRTSVDILQFAGAGSATSGTGSSSSAAASAPTGFAALAQMAPTKRKIFNIEGVQANLIMAKKITIYNFCSIPMKLGQNN